MGNSKSGVRAYPIHQDLKPPDFKIDEYNHHRILHNGPSHSCIKLPLKLTITQDHISDSTRTCHVHDKMRLRKPHLKESLPIKLCLLCDRAFCVDHKGKEEGVCEINHVTYYRNHPAAQEYLYRKYEDWEMDQKRMQVEDDWISGDEGVLERKEKGGKMERKSDG